MMALSFSRTDTGSPFKLQVHAFSQSAGHTRLVNSGKQLVLLSLANACSRLSLYSISFHSGIRLFRGHPDVMPHIFKPAWQNGTPQSIHLAACFLCSSRLSGVWNSLKFLILSLGASSALVFLSYSKNPVGFPIPTYLRS